MAGSSASGMPAFTSSMCAPAASCARTSASTRLKSPAAISAARILRPVGLMRSPIMTKGRSRPITTSRVWELTTVSVMKQFLLVRLRIAPRVPRHTAVEDPGARDDVGHGLFLAIGHEVHAVHALDGANFLDHFDALPAALECAVGGARQAADHDVWNVHPGHMSADPFGRLGGAQRTQADQDEHAVECA